MEEEKFIEFVPPRKVEKESTDPKELLETLMKFFNKDAPVVIEYIEVNNIPPHFITANRRIDLHPAREYLLRLVRISKECVAIQRLLDGESDELDNFFD